MAAVRHKRYCQEAFTGHHVTPSLRTFVVTRNGGTKKPRLDKSISDDSCHESSSILSSGSSSTLSSGSSSTLSSGSLGSMATTDSLFRFDPRKPNESSLHETQTQTFSSPCHRVKPHSDQTQTFSSHCYRVKPHSDESIMREGEEEEEEEEEQSISDPSRSETSIIPMSARELDESSSKDESSLTGRKPSCAACRNHGVTVALKGHKRHCKFAACICDKCLLTRERRTVMANSVKMTRNLKQDMEEGNGHFDPEPVTELNVQEDDTVNSKLDYSTISKSRVKNGRVRRRSIPFRGGVVVFDENVEESTITISKCFFEDLMKSYQCIEKLCKDGILVASSLHHHSPPCDTNDSSLVPLPVSWMAHQWNMSQEALQKPAITTIYSAMKKVSEHVLPPISHPSFFPLSNVLFRSSSL